MKAKSPLFFSCEEQSPTLCLTWIHIVSRILWNVSCDSFFFLLNPSRREPRILERIEFLMDPTPYFSFAVGELLRQRLADFSCMERAMESHVCILRARDTRNTWNGRSAAAVESNFHYFCTSFMGIYELQATVWWIAEIARFSGLFVESNVTLKRLPGTTWFTQTVWKADNVFDSMSSLESWYSYYYCSLFWIVINWKSWRSVEIKGLRNRSIQVPVK